MSSVGLKNQLCANLVLDLYEVSVMVWSRLGFKVWVLCSMFNRVALRLPGAKC